MKHSTFEGGGDLLVDSDLKMAVLKQAAQINIALLECSDALRAEAVTLMKQLCDPDLDEHERYSTAMLISEILFPDTDPHGWPGLDLEEAEVYAKEQSTEAVAVLGRMDSSEVHFADRLRKVLQIKGMTQDSLAQHIGVGQSAISMMLNRTCRPQNRTVLRIAKALGVDADELWPTTP
jgi:lambda repressor-like predicted transcriptional regulator